MGVYAVRDQEKREVEVNRMKLIETLEKNKEQHVKDYKEALAGYKEKATEKLSEEYLKAKVSLEKNLEQARKKIQDFDPEDPESTGYLQLINGVKVEMRVPYNYEDEYDAAIDLAKWDVNETIKLSFFEFQCFVRDKWDWKDDFTAVSSMYVKGK